jgi:muramoyltetrapeptide carboxypeptidase
MSASELSRIVITPPRAVAGSEVRVIAPSRSLAMISPEVRHIASSRLRDLGFDVTIAKHAEECDVFGSSSVASRIADIHDAFADPNVRVILTAIGGYSCNELLEHLPYDLIRKSPKILCGFSDVTALQAALLARARLMTYSGPHFSTFGVAEQADYIVESFVRCVHSSAPFAVAQSETWSDDEWWTDQRARCFHANTGPIVIGIGSTEGRLIVGNLSTLCLLLGTAFMPPLAGSVLMLEDEASALARTPMVFGRLLQSLVHQPEFREVRALLLGRFPRAAAISEAQLRALIARHPELQRIPVIADLDFGHTLPLATLPMGGWVRVVARERAVKLEIVAH